jgi:hypothetical protein
MMYSVKSKQNPIYSETGHELLSSLVDYLSRSKMSRSSSFVLIGEKTSDWRKQAQNKKKRKVHVTHPEGERYPERITVVQQALVHPTMPTPSMLCPAFHHYMSVMKLISWTHGSFEKVTCKPRKGSSPVATSLFLSNSLLT